MLRFVIRALVGALGLWVASRIVPGIAVHSLASLLWAAVLLGVVNAIVRPILLLLTLPITVLTLGLFLLVINGLMLMLVAVFVHGFVVHGLWAAILGSIVVSLTSWVADMVLGRLASR
jgi:putative membrane protein